jgi:cation diffusion facilitator family transporter
MKSDRSSLTQFAWLSIAAAIATIGLKLVAYFLTGSVGLFSDAIESFVNLFGALMALWMLTLASRGADRKHPYGHSKAEYFSSGAEGGLIILAAASIAYTAVERLLHPRPLEQVGIGLGVSVLASAINFLVAKILLNAGKRHNSITLEADAHHLMTDVWTSAGVLGGVGAVALTGWTWLDPIVAIAVSANIVWTGVSLVRRSIDGLMDVVLPPVEQETVEKVMNKYREKEIEFHALRTRQAAAHRFVTVHMLVPGEMTVHDAHHLAEDFEQELRTSLKNATVTTHIEPIEDENSFHRDMSAK